LVAFNAGRLQLEDLEKVGAHLAGCGHCESALLNLESSRDWILDNLRGIGQDQPFLQEPECQLLEARARAIQVDRSIGLPRTQDLAAAALGDASDLLGGLAMHQVVDHYRVQERIGRGGMGAVYKAWHPLLRRTVALKVLFPQGNQQRLAVARFLREMAAVGRLDHSHLVRALDAGEADGLHFLAMEFLDGVDLSRAVRLHGRLAIADACEAIRQAALGLQHAHEHGLVHRDIKPSNLMLTMAGQVKVLDLGLARLYGLGDVETPGEELTGPHHVMGTADFMAPEQGVDAHRVDIRADIYSLGCTLYKLLAGKAPFSDLSSDLAEAKLEAHARMPVPPLRRLRPEVPAALVALVERMLAKSPAERFAEPVEVAERLTPFTKGHNLSALAAKVRAKERQLVGDTPDAGRPATKLGSSSLAAAAARWSRSRRPWVAAALLLLTLGSGLNLTVNFWREPTASPYLESVHQPADVDRQPPAPLAPGVWRDLLEQPPTRLLWPSERFNPRLYYDEGKREITVTCQGNALLALGETKELDFQIEMDMHQNPWAGNVGLFFGYQDTIYQGRPTKKYQLLRFQHAGRQPSTYIFAWQQLFCHDTPGFYDCGGMGASELFQLDPQHHRVRMTVQGGQLVRVTWDGTALPRLSTAEASLPPTSPTEYHGTFGIFLERSHGLFRHVRYRFGKITNDSD
jgi:serine/threonine protein kinase